MTDTARFFQPAESINETAHTETYATWQILPDSLICLTDPLDCVSRDMPNTANTVDSCTHRANPHHRACQDIHNATNPTEIANLRANQHDGVCRNIHRPADMRNLATNDGIVPLCVC